MEEEKKIPSIMLTGDRPTGRLHIGHYVGSLRRRVELQNQGGFDEMYIMIADTQALTDNAGNIQKVRDNLIEVALDLGCIHTVIRLLMVLLRGARAKRGSGQGCHNGCMAHVYDTFFHIITNLVLFTIHTFQLVHLHKCAKGRNIAWDD